MRESVKDPGRLEHILMAIDNVFEFLQDKEYEDLSNDKLLFFGVVKNIEIVGEAANHLTNELQNQHPEIDWPSVVGMRNVLVHDYYNINPRIAWTTATKNFPVLREQIESILSTLKKDE